MAEEPPITVEPPSRFAPGNGIARVLWGVVLVTLALAVLAYGAIRWLDSDNGRTFIVNQLPRIEMEIGFGVRADRIEGSIFGEATIYGLKLLDTKGVFAEVPRLEIDWRPLDLLTKTFSAKRITTPEMRVLRRPVFNPSTSPTFFPDFNFAIDRFRIDRLALEAPVAGSRRVLGVGGKLTIKKGRALADLTVLTLGETAKGAGDTLRLHLDTEPDADKFDIDGLIIGPKGGVITNLLGLQAPLEARLTGDGKWSAWAGRLDAQLGGKPIAALALTGKSGLFTATGTATPGAVITGLPARLTAPQLNIDARVQLADGRAAINAVFTSAAIDLRILGDVYYTDETFKDVAVTARLLQPAAIDPRVSGRDVRLTARIAGTFVNPLIDYRLTAATLGWGTTIATDLRVAGIIRAGTTPLVIPMAASATRITGLGDAATPFLTNVRIDGTLRWGNGVLTGDNVRYRSDRASGTVTLLFNPTTGVFLVTSSAAVQQVPIPGLGLANVSADLRIASSPSGPGISGPVRVQVTRLDNAAIASLTEGLPIITADIAVAGDQSITIRSARVASPGLNATGSGSLSAKGDLRLSAAGTSRAYGPFTITAAGPMATPTIDITLAKPGLGIGLANVAAHIAPVAGGWRFKAQGDSSYGPISTLGTLRTGAPLTLDLEKLEIAGLTGHGTLAQTPAGPFAGRIDIAGRGLTGVVAVSAEGSVQRADISLTAKQARIELATPITIDSGTLKLAMLLPASGPTTSGSFALNDVRRGDLIIDATSGTINYANGHGQAAVTAKGRADLGFDGKIGVDFTPDRATVTASGSLDGRPITLSGPMILERTASGWVLAPVTVITTEGKLVLSGQFGDTKAINAKLDRVSLSLLTLIRPSLDLNGRVSGTIDLALDANGVPTGSAALRINALSRQGIASASVPIDIGINALLDARATAIRAVIVRAGKVEGRAQMRIGPIPPGDEPLTERLFASPVFGQLRYQGPAEAVWGLAGVNGIDVRGAIAISADVSGVLGIPRLIGSARSEGARVESTALGAVIDQASLEARFTESRLELVRFGGRVGRNGSISGTGGIDLAAERSFPMDIRLVLKNAALVNRDDVTATASGNVRIATDEYGGVISGKLHIDEARYRLGTTAAAQVPVLPVTEINTHVLGRRVNVYVAPTRWLLNLQVAADRRLFVSGMGLESEWRADVKVRGPVTAPEITGRVELVRGDYDFAGKRFTLTRGDLRFQGGFPPDPTINVSATSTANGFTAQLDITGTASRPAIAFSSVPALPEDEILSRILFGESVTNLSAPEAVQLAAALSSLRGGGGFNPINMVRSGLGIDRLRILPADSTTGRKTSIAAGQYIGRNVYIELATDAQGYTATRIEISLTRSLSILSEVATLGGTSASIRWKRDY